MPPLCRLRRLRIKKKAASTAEMTTTPAATPTPIDADTDSPVEELGTVVGVCVACDVACDVGVAVATVDDTPVVEVDETVLVLVEDVEVLVVEAASPRVDYRTSEIVGKPMFVQDKNKKAKQSQDGENTHRSRVPRRMNVRPARSIRPIPIIAFAHREPTGVDISGLLRGAVLQVQGDWRCQCGCRVNAWHRILLHHCHKAGSSLDQFRSASVTRRQLHIRSPTPWRQYIPTYGRETVLSYVRLTVSW